MTLYDPSPQHPWNRAHRALFLRHDRDGAIHGGDTVDPLLWPQTRHLREAASREAAIAALGDAIALPGAGLMDPVRRAVLQNDLWAVYDWLAATPAAEQDDGSRRLMEGIAIAMAELALDAESVRALPDTLAAAADSGRHPSAFDPQHPATPFLPPNLLDPAGPWVVVGRADGAPAAALHTQFASGRSVFLVLLRLPDGREATIGHIARLARDRGRRAAFDPAAARLSPGTHLALVRQMMHITETGALVPTPLTQSVQLRVLAPAPDPGGRDDAAVQQVYEWVLTRQGLYADRARSLRPVSEEERPFLQFMAHDVDPLEVSDVHAVGPVRLRSCHQCHVPRGMSGFQTWARFGMEPGPALLTPTSRDREVAAVATWKAARGD